MSLTGARQVDAPCLMTSRTSEQYIPLLKSDLKKKCTGGYEGVNFDDEVTDMQRDTRRLPHPEYLRLAMSHRFCLVAPGDFVSTHKVSEAMALGAAGGCIPVFVLPPIMGKLENHFVDVEHYLPYARWLDWCGVAYFVTERHARSRMRDILSMLEARPSAELRAKRARLKEVRNAFIFRRESSPARPSASEFILGDVCAAARLISEGREPPPPAGGDHARCVLVAPPEEGAPPEKIATRVSLQAPIGGVVPNGYSFKYRSG